MKQRPGERRVHIQQTKQRINLLLNDPNPKIRRLMTDREYQMLDDYGRKGLTYKQIAAKHDPPLHHTRVMQIVQRTLTTIERQLDEDMRAAREEKRGSTYRDAISALFGSGDD